MAELYRLDFASGKSYIGVTRKTSQARYDGHAAASFNGGHYCIHRAWCKHGPPRLAVLAIVEDSMLRETERRAVEVFGTLYPDGYNMIPGGELAPSYARIGKKHTKKSRKKMSNSAKCRVISEESIKSRSKKLSALHTGRKHTKKARRNMSRAQKGKKKSLEHIKKIADSLRGRKWTEKTRAIQAIARKGRVFTEETKAKISASHLGMKHTKETKRKIGERPMSEKCLRNLQTCRIGVKHTEETKAKMSESHKRRNQLLKTKE